MTQITETPQTTPVLLSVRQFCERHTFLTEAALRSLLFNRRTNGLTESGTVLNLGRKLLIDEDRFFQWLEAQNALKRAGR